YYALRQSDLSEVWEYRMEVPYDHQTQECDAAAIWNGTDLIEGGGGPTTIGTTTYQGSVQALDPATGIPVWQPGLPGPGIGRPTEDGAGLVAAPTFSAPTGQVGVYLLDGATGTIVDFIPTPQSNLFGQPVFAGKDLLVPAGTDLGLTAYEVTRTGPAVTSV